MRTDLERRQALVDIRDTVREWGEKLKFSFAQKQTLREDLLAR